MNHVEKKLAFQKQISKIISDINQINFQDFNLEINKIFIKLCQEIGADSCKLLLRDTNDKYIESYKYCKKGLDLKIPFDFIKKKWVPVDRKDSLDFNSIIQKDINKKNFFTKNTNSIKTNIRILLSSRSGEEGIFDFSSLSIKDEWDYDLVPGLRMLGESILNTREAIRIKSNLNLSERKYQDLVEMSMALIYKCNKKSEFTFLNPAWKDSLGYEVEYMLGKSFVDFIPESEIATNLKAYKSLCSGNSIINYETTFVDKDGKKKIFVFTCKPEYDIDGDIVGTQGAGFDITDRKQMEDELIDSRNKLRSLTIELSENEQRQNKKLAGIIHDSIGQEIAMLKVALGQLTIMGLSNEAQNIVSDTRDKLEGLLDITRDVIQNLYPPVLNEMGLIPAIEWLGDQFINNHDINFSFTYKELPFEFKKNISQTLFLIVKELIVNAIKHANASMLAIKIDYNPGKFYMYIFDNGRGFVSDSCKFKKCGLGLINTKERIENLNGYVVLNKMMKGTEITIGLPLRKELLVCV